MRSNVSIMRKRENLTQAQLAKDIGISRRALSSIPAGVIIKVQTKRDYIVCGESNSIEVQHSVRLGRTG